MKHTAPHPAVQMVFQDAGLSFNRYMTIGDSIAEGADHHKTGRTAEGMAQLVGLEGRRKEKEINTTLELVEVIKSATGANYFFKNHPERKIFQAIRIAVNNELDVLKKVLPDAIEALNHGGRLSVISFHSLEDRIVKNVFKEYSEVNEIFKGLPNIPEEYQAKIKLINKKPILASEDELKENSRSHSAKLRIVERI